MIDLADEIAYLTADMDDGMEAGMLQSEVLRSQVQIFDDSLRAAEREYPAAPGNLLANEALKRMLNTLVGDPQRVFEFSNAPIHEAIRHRGRSVAQ